MADTHPAALKQEDFLSLLRGYNPEKRISYERDMISNRYQILTGQPLQELSSPFANAYVVRDKEDPERSLYALVHDNTIPLRQKNIRALLELRHPNLVALLDEGVAEISTVSEARYVTILERPAGQSLSEIFSKGKSPISESSIIQLLRPLTQVLIAFSDLGISHNRINLSNVYISNGSVVIGECISGPSGYSQEPVFEPIDRLLASVWAKPDFAINADCYALAVLTLHLILGYQPFASMKREKLIDEILTKGSYHALVAQWDLSDSMEDFFRGLLNDVHKERWDPKVIETWLTGKHFNLILPSVQRETSHGFEFLGRAYYSRKAIAEALFENWHEARAVLFDNKLARWIDTGPHKSEVADAVSRISSNNGGDNARAERLNSELLARIIIMLDPSGPIRFRNLSVSADGLGVMLANAVLHEQHEEIQTLAQIIENDFVSFWIDQQKPSPEHNLLNAKFLKVRNFIRTSGLGFGIERCLYDLYPGLPCQSPLIKRYCVTELPELLRALDTIAPQRGHLDFCIDRHIAAFIASKLDISKELRIQELEGLPELSKNPKLVALKLLMRAQHKAGEPPLKGLTYWMAAHLFGLLDHIHKRSLRHKLQATLRDVAGRGLLQTIAGIMLNSQLFRTDYEEFQHAAADYAARGIHIIENKNHVYLSRHSRIAGRGIAQTVAFGICLTTIYITLRSYFRF